MNTNDLLFVLTLSIFSSATDTKLDTNTNFLLLLLLAMSGNSNTYGNFGNPNYYNNCPCACNYDNWYNNPRNGCGNNYGCNNRVF